MNYLESASSHFTIIWKSAVIRPHLILTSHNSKHAALLWLGNSYAVAMGILICFFSQIPLRLFTADTEVIRYGVMMGQVLDPSYILLITCQILIGTARGTGDTLNTMLLSIINLYGLRIIWLTVMIPHIRSIYTLYPGYPITWGTAALCMIVYYYRKIRPCLKVN